MRFLDLFHPEHYQLDLKVDKFRGQIHGTVTITGTQPTPGRKIRLHAVGMEILDVSLNGETPLWQYQDGVLIIQVFEGLSEPLEVGVDYRTPLRRNMESAYLSTYQHEGHEERLVATHFESHYARGCFPCVDEPAAKATFTLSITTPNHDDLVLSNTPITNTETLVEGQKVIFEKTPRMSTYLLAFVVGKFQSHSQTSAHGVEITTYAALNQDPESLPFATETAVRALDFYEEKFGVPYPLPKLDQVALPDFAAGAMENWGLVTYREAHLLVGPRASFDTRRSVASTIAHELSHQWFGNLVTMQWWDELWLNESFANAMEFFAVDAIYPEYDIWRDFYTGDCVRALRRDALPGVQAVQQPVETVEMVDSIFDHAIVYAKGARLLVMLARLLGLDNFLAGVHTYLTEHQYQNTVGDDFWAALQPHADFDVREFMHAWITRPGFPLLQKAGDTWHQHRFTLTNQSTRPSHWPLPTVTDDMTGHYLIGLDDAEFSEKLAKVPDLSREQRLRLIVDRTLLAKSPAVSSSSLVDLLDKLAPVADLACWEVLNTAIDDLAFLCPQDSDGKPLLQAFLRPLLQPQLQELGYVRPDPQEASDRTDLRNLMVGLAVYADDAATLDTLTSLYTADLEQIDAEARLSVLVAAIKRQEDTVFPELAARYQTETDAERRHDLLAAVTSARHSQNTAVLLDWLKAPTIVRPQDHLHLTAYLLRNTTTCAATRAWIYQHWDYLERAVDTHAVALYLTYIAHGLRTEADAAEFWQFVEPKADQPSLQLAITTARPTVENNLRQLRDDQAAVWDRLRAAQN